MKNSNNKGFDQHHNVQVAVEKECRLIVGNTLSKRASDREEAIPTVDAIPAQVGRPKAAALDNGYWSPTNVEELLERGIEPFIATGRDSHNQSWRERFTQQPGPPAEDASLIVKMAYKLRTVIGKGIYGLRKIDRGTDHQHYQGDLAIPPVLAERAAASGRRGVSGMSSLQLEEAARPDGWLETSRFLSERLMTGEEAT
jgi:hypothetical protein